MNSKNTKQKIRILLKRRKKPFFIVNVSEIPNLEILSPQELLEMFYQTGSIIEQSKTRTIIKFRVFKNPLKNYLIKRKSLKLEL